jgi:mannitol/fructose-specific phosphotransferase system IIA component (Ntr-type)
MLITPLGADGFLVTRDGIAVSHPRHPIVVPVSEPTITVCLAEDPIPLGHRQSRPVRVFLALFCPTVTLHLAVLARLSRLIARDQFLRAIDGHRPDEEVMDLIWLHDCGLADEE